MLLGNNNSDGSALQLILSSCQARRELYEKRCQCASDLPIQSLDLENRVKLGGLSTQETWAEL